MNIKLKTAIMAIDSTEELNEAIRLIKLMRKEILAAGADSVKSWIRPGMKVNVVLRRGAGTETGTVDKVKIKKAIIKIDGQLWDCPLDMITKVA